MISWHRRYNILRHVQMGKQSCSHTNWHREQSEAVMYLLLGHTNMHPEA